MPSAYGVSGLPFSCTGAVVWLTGLSASGKSTIACALHARLTQQNRLAYVLDGDLLRKGLCVGLGYSASDRHENVRRAAVVAAMFAEAKVIAIVALISPYRTDRAVARTLAEPAPFIEVHLSTSLAECERRDPKGLYRKARAGQLPGFTGIDDPYEDPADPEVRLDTAKVGVEACVDGILAALPARAPSRA